MLQISPARKIFPSSTLFFNANKCGDCSMCLLTFLIYKHKAQQKWKTASKLCKLLNSYHHIKCGKIAYFF